METIDYLIVTLITIGVIFSSLYYNKYEKVQTYARMVNTYSKLKLANKRTIDNLVGYSKNNLVSPTNLITLQGSVCIIALSYYSHIWAAVFLLIMHFFINKLVFARTITAATLFFPFIMFPGFVVYYIHGFAFTVVVVILMILFTNYFSHILACRAINSPDVSEQDAKSIVKEISQLAANGKT